MKAHTHSRAPFEELADRVSALRSQMSFAEAAAKALEEIRPWQNFSMEELVSEIAASGTIAKQQDLDSTFGNPAVTLAHRGDFHVQLLSWRDGTTSIHEHAFEGAFCVLSGASVHTTYRFESDTAPLAAVMGGSLRFVNTELLEPGEVRSISRGAELIHSVFHLARPSISLVVRTSFDDTSRPQYEYVDGLAVDSFRRDALELRKLQLLDLSLDCYPNQQEKVVDGILASSSAWLAYRVLELSALRLGSFASLRHHLPALKAKHGEVAESFERAVLSRLRLANIVNRRCIVADEEHRFLLALLMLLPDRSSVLELVRERHPDLDAPELVVRWLRELAAKDCEARWGPNPLGFEIDDAAEEFLLCILLGDSIETAASKASQSPSRQAELALVVPRLSLLRPLFV